MWQALVAAFGAILVMGGYVWYKLRQVTQAQADAVTARAETTQAQAAQKALETQVAEKAAQDKKELQDAIDAALVQPTEDERLKEVLAALARVRGKL